MKYLRRFVIALLIISQFIAPTGYADSGGTALAYNDDAITVVTPTSPLPAPPLFITSYMVDQLPVYVQIYNSTSDIVDLSAWQLNYTLRSAVDNELVDGALTLSGYIKPNSYLVVGDSAIVTNPDIALNIGADSADFKEVTALSLTAAGYGDNPWDKTIIMLEGGGQYYLKKASGTVNYTSKATYSVVTEEDFELFGGGYYSFIDSTPLRITELLANQANCAPLDNNTTCHDFVEIQNRSDTPVDLSGYRLRIGYGNVAASVTNSVPLTGVLDGGSFLAVQARSDGEPLDLTAGGGSAWLEDIYGLHIYAETAMNYSDFSDTTDKGIAYALDDSDGTWKNATNPTPGTVNDFSVPTIEPGRGGVEDNSVSTLEPCAANQYRNPETNRCKLIAIVTSTFGPCAEGQYRSAETNRCRSLTSAISQLAPCAADQYRNPDTGRCKLIASLASDTLKPCAEGQERNPDTNRCRKVAASIIPAADFPVDVVNETAKSFVGWYALGGVLLLGVGYGVLEWRHEIGQLIRKAATVVHRR